MVSFWPWSREDSSPASFEKALSTLSIKITESQTRLERARATSRRVRVLWTLYLSFAYLIYAIVLLLVVGYQNLSPWEWAGIGCSPFAIFITREAFALFFNFRIESISAHLKQQQDERARTIQKLKDATKYDSTLQLLEKYGGNEGKQGKGKKGQWQREEGEGPEEEGKQRQQRREGGAPGRTTGAPPPTANIQRRDGHPSAPSAPQAGHGDPRISQPPPHPPQGLEPTAEFAPNAYAHSQPPQHYPSHQYVQADQSVHSSNWYDRIFDLLLGEDETAPKNRIVLICQTCRLVNGQAPPGTKSLSEIGTWKCMSCGASNGEMDEGKRIMHEVLGAQEGDDTMPAGEEFKDSDSEEGETSLVGAVSPAEDKGHSTGKHSSAAARQRRAKKG